MLVWLVVAVLVGLVVFLVDFSRYSNELPTDNEIDEVGNSLEPEDNDLEVGSSVDENVETDIPEFVE